MLTRCQITHETSGMVSHAGTHISMFLTRMHWPQNSHRATSSLPRNSQTRTTVCAALRSGTWMVTTFSSGDLVRPDELRGQTNASLRHRTDRRGVRIDE